MLRTHIKKNVPWHILAPSAVACDIFLLRASAHPAERLFLYGKCDAISYKEIKGTAESETDSTMPLIHSAFDVHYALSTRPDFKHEVQTCILLDPPFTLTFTHFTLAFHI